MIIDGHHHIVDSSEPILRLMDAQQVEHCVLVGVVDLAGRRPNLWFDTSSYFVTGHTLRRLVSRVGTQRIVFGSDMPVMAHSMTEGIDKIKRLQLRANDEAALLGNNLRSLLRPGEGRC